jgi:hypothetical protein
MWIKFANLARKSDRMKLAQKTIESLRPHVDQVSTNSVPELSYSRFSFIASFPGGYLRASQVHVGEWFTCRGCRVSS